MLNPQANLFSRVEAQIDAQSISFDRGRADASFSLSENLDFSAIAQYLSGNSPHMKTQAAMAFLRLKYSF